MTFTYGFFNSVNSDRLYDATDVGRLFDGLLNDGVLPNVGTAFAGRASGSDFILGSGRAWFNGTWSYNDSDEIIPTPTPSNINNRIDSLVIEVDRRLAVRANQLIWVEGTPSVNPVPPVLTTTSDVTQYALFDVYRRRDTLTITNNDITRVIGTARCPISTMALSAVEIFDIANYKRQHVRGTYLGTTFTSAQRAAVRSGSFEGLYLGDFWRHGNVNWRIVDFNYAMGAPTSTATSTTTGTVTRFTQPHLVIVPDDTRALYAPRSLFTGAARSASNCGYYFSARGKDRDTAIARTHAAGLFGLPNIVNHRVGFPSTYSAAANAMNVRSEYWSAIPMTSIMVNGHNNGIASGVHTAQADQLALYKHSTRLFWMGQDNGDVLNIGGSSGLYGPTWLMDQWRVSDTLCMHDWGGIWAHNGLRTTDHQHRPAIIVTGKA